MPQTGVINLEEYFREVLAVNTACREGAHGLHYDTIGRKFFDMAKIKWGIPAARMLQALVLKPRMANDRRPHLKE
jgi:hypothetical protein